MTRFLLLLIVLVAVVSGATAASAAPASTDPIGVWPLGPPAPEVVRGFDPPDGPYGAGHRGVDLLGFPGETVRSALAGSVTFVGTLAGRGVVVVDHGATRTTYEPVSASVEVGDTVGTGAQIGTLQSGASHCPPRACLHWGWIRGDTYLDPLRLVGAGPVRLLPLWRAEPEARAPTPLPYTGWQPLAVVLHQLVVLELGAAEAQARGCACW